MPTRGIPWEQLPLPHERYRPKVAQPEKEEVKIPEIIPVERDLVKDLSNIARRAAFGLVCGTITGMCLGSVEVLRDPKLMVAKSAVASAKVFRYSYLYGGFFATYHGYRKILHIYYPQTLDNNVLSAGVLSLIPLATIGQFRFMLPYGALLIGLDYINGINDI